MLPVSFKKHPGRLSHKMRIHLLHQFTLAAARDRRLLAYLFDMKQRIGVMDGVKAHVNGSRKSLETIEALLVDPKKRAELQEAYARAMRVAGVPVVLRRRRRAMTPTGKGTGTS